MLQRARTAVQELMDRVASTAAPRAAALRRNSVDDAVLRRLHQANDSSGVSRFEALWANLSTGRRELQTRQDLAKLYASAMHAAKVSNSDLRSFQDCTDIGERALELDEDCTYADEQLVIAHGIMLSSLNFARKLCDRMAVSRNLAGLRAEDVGMKSPPTQRPESVSPDYLYAYWRIYRNDIIRDPQALRALNMYKQAPAAERSFDAEVRRFEMLSANLRRAEQALR